MRVARITLIVVVILGGLFVAADRIAVHVVQNKVAERAQSSEGLATRPKVAIEGFPFLTQAVGRKLDEVKISTTDIAAGEGVSVMRIDRFQADLHGVRLSNGFTRAVADSADGSAFITYADLTNAAPKGITVSYGGADSDGRPMVKLTTTYQGAHLSVLSQVSVRGADSIGLKADTLPKEITALGLDDEVRQQIDFARQLTHMPSGISLSDVTVSQDGISVGATGKDVVLAG